MFFQKIIIIFFIFFIVCFDSFAKDKTDMVLIPSGSYIPLFKYGDDVLDDESIDVDSFYIDKYPVTNIDFYSFVKKKPEWDGNNFKLIFADRNYLNHWKNIDSFDEINNYPVVNVSWFAANEYCLYLGSRLPTLDEWEYVASSGKEFRVAKDDPSYLHNLLDWYINSQSRGVISIDKMTDNYWGVFGLHGVVWEWVSDFNSVILLNTDAEGGGLEEVLYCGATATNAVDPADYAAFMRFAFRNSLEADYTINTLGFRCVKNIK